MSDGERPIDEVIRDLKTMSLLGDGSKSRYAALLISECERRGFIMDQFTQPYPSAIYWFGENDMESCRTYQKGDTDSRDEAIIRACEEALRKGEG